MATKFASVEPRKNEYTCSLLLLTQMNLYTMYIALLGHNTDGKYFVTSNKLAFKCELNPRKVNVWIEKARDGRITPILDVDVRDVACGVNHTVSSPVVLRNRA